MIVADHYRKVAIGVLGVVFAGLLAAQSIGIALTQKSPQTAVRAFPKNGLAEGNLASSLFALANSGAGGEGITTNTSGPRARTAYLSEPLSPKALSILALDLPKGTERRDFVELASQISRRDQRLLGVILQEYVEANDYRGTINTLDNILRVRPSRSTELFPGLLAVFSQDGAVDEFRKVLDGTSPWHGKFLKTAINHSAALPNLVRLRPYVSFTDQDFDEALIRKLAQSGEMGQAAQLYRTVSETPGLDGGGGPLPWVSTYAPIDWFFADEGDIRAQPALNSDLLEIYIRSGQGGILARRYIIAPPVPFEVSVSHELQPSDQAKDVGLELNCAGSTNPIASSDFDERTIRLTVNKLPPECEFMEIRVRGRAWTGRAALRGTITPIAVDP